MSVKPPDPDGVTSAVPVRTLLKVPTPAMVTLVARATLHASVTDVPEAGTARKCANLGLPELSPGAREAIDAHPDSAGAVMRLLG